MTELMICPVKKLYRYAEDGDMENVAALAVSSYDIETERLAGFGWRLCLYFDDVTGGENAMTGEIAAEIAAYVRSLPENLDTLFVCCDGGQSRSTAMAAAITRFWGRDDMSIWKNPRYFPNPLVYTLLCEALGIPVSPAQVQEKQEISRKALADAIGNT